MKSPYAEVIGDPVAHSRSPQIHRFWLDALGRGGDYRATRVTRAELSAFIAGRRADPDWRGCNVTMPLKLDALHLADEATDQALAAGAANLLIRRNGGLTAVNTDVRAIGMLLGRLAKRGAAFGSVTILGNGGAARAALVALKLLGVSAVRIQARDMVAARKLSVEFGLDVGPAPLTAPIESDGLINATPLGMPGRDCLNCELGGLPDKGWVFDMVTDPDDTPLLQAARARGLRTVAGLDMLVEQADRSFRLLFGVDAPRDRDVDLWQKLGR